MIAWLAETALAVTMLMLAVLALRGPVARLFGAGWAYALWAIPALRLVLPPLPLLSPEIPLPSVVLFIPTTAGVAAPLPADAGPGQWVPFMLAMWAGGAVIFLILQWLSYRLFLQRLRGTARRARPPTYGGIATWVSRIVEGPLALGLIERRIVVPSDFSRRYSPGERRLAMEHELTHHRRGDIWWNAAAVVMLALNWFNPVAWIAFRAFRADQELACDAAVAAAATPDERHDYASALVKSASRPGLIAACHLHGAGQLKRRLRMMRQHRGGGARSAGGAAALAGLAAAAFTLGSPSFSQADGPQPQPDFAAAAPQAAALAPARPPLSPPAAVGATARPAKAARRARPPVETEPAAAPVAPAALAALDRLGPELVAMPVAPAALPPQPARRVTVRVEHHHAVRLRSARGARLIFFQDASEPRSAEVTATVQRLVATTDRAEQRVLMAALRSELQRGLGRSRVEAYGQEQGETKP